MNITTTPPVAFVETQYIMYFLVACIIFLSVITFVLFAEIEEGSNCNILLSLIRLKLTLWWLRCRGRAELLDMPADLEPSESDYTAPIND